MTRVGNEFILTGKENFLYICFSCRRYFGEGRKTFSQKPYHLSNSPCQTYQILKSSRVTLYVSPLLFGFYLGLSYESEISHIPT